MSETRDQEIKRLNLENILWFVFIIACLINIQGNTDEIDYLNTNNQKSADDALNQYVLALLITFCLYCYFANRNYRFLSEAREAGQDTSFLEIRFIGSVLLIIGILFILYFQLNLTEPESSPAL